MSLKIYIIDTKELSIDDLTKSPYLSKEDRDSFINYKNLDVKKEKIVSTILKRKYIGEYILNEYGKPITIGNDCWFGGNVTILPGVTIQDNVVVGAGSVVTHDLESGAIYVGNPARKIRDITKEDSIFLKKELW